MNEVLKFDDFLNEELNITRYDNGVCRLSERWFYYNPDDDIIYGCDEKPVLDDNILFAFNPVSCTILLGEEEKQYDVNNPICLIQYIIEDGKITIYTDDALEFLNGLGFTGTEITSQTSRFKLQDIFESDDDYRYILVYGDQMIASTFDVIEEN